MVPMLSRSGSMRCLHSVAMSSRKQPSVAAFTTPSAMQWSTSRRRWSTCQRAVRTWVSMKSDIARGAEKAARSKLPRLWLPDSCATEQLGSLLAQDLRPSDVILLSGSLGAGKTSFARGYIQESLGDEMLQVTSPTYLLVNTYPPKPNVQGPTVYHMDLWRLQPGKRRPVVDFEDVFRNHVSLIEWPDRLGEICPANFLEVLLEYPERAADIDDDDPWGFGAGHTDGPGSAREGRFATLKPAGTTWEKRLTKFQDQVAVLDDDGRTVLVKR